MSELGQMALRYVDKLQPPPNWKAYLRGRFLDREFLIARVIGRREADALSDCEGVYDARYAEYPAIEEKGRCAVLTCSVCCGQTIVRYQKKESQPAEVEWWSPTDGVSLVNCYGHDMVCPQCGWDCRLQGCRDFSNGWVQAVRLCVPYVLGGMLFLADVLAERRRFKKGEEWYWTAIQAFVFDEKHHARLTNYRKGMYASQLIYTGWEERKRLSDEMGCRALYDEALPPLENSVLENCRLWDYYRQSNDGEVFWPVAWLRLWQKHHNAEVLIDAGLGYKIGMLLKKDCGDYYGSCARMPKMACIDWKKKKPAAMLGMSRPELERLKRTDLSEQGLRLVLERRGEAGRIMELLERCKNNTYELESLLALPFKAERVLGYLEKQGRGIGYLQDFWRMAEECGLDLSQEVVRWPKDLTREHDRVMALRKVLDAEKKDMENAEEWLKMNRRTAGLCWEKNGICIRPAHSTKELVEEGEKLHHCVGGYTDSHLAGKIILFIRHTRRPERSWYTLNINLETRMRIQLHGYGNERANGKELHIPKEVLAFVKEWEETVLANWQDPKQKEKKNGKRTEAA